MKTKVVNFVSGPSCGKSVMCALTFAELKTLHKSAELIQEYAKQLVWAGNFEELNNQYHVSLTQYQWLKAVDGKVDYICTDSPLLTGLVYNRIYRTNVCNVEKTEQMILSKMDEFENIYIYLERNEEFPFELNGRVHNESESKHIDILIKHLLDELGVKYLTVKSSKESVTAIVDYINNQ